ncbi:MAG: acyl-CoA dehydratase activase [Thermodesulfobacteriota bacterium]
MIYAGCDVGSLTSKAVIMKHGRILGRAVIPSRARPQLSGQEVMDLALGEARLCRDRITACVGTGYGRDNLSFVQAAISEITCHARGGLWLLPTARTIIDVGGQDCKAFRIDDRGIPVKFLTNDKCASGTGRFLEVMAKLLGIGMADLGGLSDRSGSPITFASTCTVWVQADVIKHLNDGRTPEDIGAGINIAMANRVAMLASAVHPEPDICMTGGVAKNEGVVQALEKLLGARIKRVKKADPQLAGAIGAALLAAERDGSR